jgi:hypothetical protein
MFLYALVSEDESKIDNDNFYFDNQDLQIEDYVSQPML